MKENYSFDINIYVSSTDIYQWWRIDMKVNMVLLHLQ